MTRRPLALGRAAFAMLCGPGMLAACTGSPIDLGVFPETEAGTPEQMTCVTDNDCLGDAFCNKPSCDAPAGVCTEPPADCDNSEGPVCGCDGITYFNDCLRRRAEVNPTPLTQCQPGAYVYCDKIVQCPTGAWCFRTDRPGHGPCPTDAPGSCWVLPETCPVTNVSANWADCDPSGICTDLCDAIVSGRVYRPTPRCP